MTASDFRFHHITLQVKQIRYTFLVFCTYSDTFIKQTVHKKKL